MECRAERGCRHGALFFLALCAFVVATGLAAPVPVNPSGGGNAPAGAGTILCRVLEAKTASHLDVRLVIFHQAQPSEGSRLGKLLRAHDGAQAEFETSDGWHSGTVLRLGSCFGRGLLVFHGASLRLAKGQEFRLRFSAPPAAFSTRQGRRKPQTASPLAAR